MIVPYLVYYSPMRSTKPRRAILDIFRSHKTPLEVQEIFSLLEKQKEDVDLATVYRSLTTFVESSIIHPIDFADGVTRYELSSLPHHHHAICTNCGKVQDVKNCNDISVQSDIEKKLKFEVKTHSMEFFGLCSGCHR